MWVWLDRAGPILFDATLSTALFLTFVVLAMLICRQPARRLLIARIAIPGSLAILPLVALAPMPRFDVVDAIIKSELVPTSLIVDPDRTTRIATDSHQLDQDGSSRLAQDAHHQFWGDGRWLSRSLILIDLACVGTGLAWLMLGFWGVRWLIRHSRSPSATTQDIHNRLLKDIPNERCHPILRVTSRVQHPVVVGLLRPTILIPQVFDERASDPELLRLSLLHEIAHATRWDSWFGTIASLAQTVWFVLPQVWWIRSQLLIDQEFMADRYAARRYGTSSGYAASLLSVAESRPSVANSTRPSSSASSSSAERRSVVRSPLSQRVLMLLYCPFPVESRAPRSWSWSLRIAIVGISIVAASVCVRWPDARALAQRLHDSVPVSQPFCVKDFRAEPLILTPGGRAMPYSMPVALPLHFKLSVDVLSSLADLGKIRISGLPLGVAIGSSDFFEPAASSTSSVDVWHHVRLERRGDEYSLWIDDQPITASWIDEHTTTDWLTFEPSPHHAAQFRNLIITW
jgi:beta-lactamase regulating signal transducer with metallopeptidase domain